MNDQIKIGQKVHYYYCGRIRKGEVIKIYTDAVVIQAGPCVERGIAPRYVSRDFSSLLSLIKTAKHANNS